MTIGEPAAPDDGTPQVRALRDAHQKLEWYRRARGQLLLATVIAGILPLVAAFRPGVFPPVVGALAFPAWAGLGLLTAGSALAEWLWYRRMVKHADALGRLPPR
jgi:hypothetical protein